MNLWSPLHLNRISLCTLINAGFSYILPNCWYTALPTCCDVYRLQDATIRLHILPNPNRSISEGHRNPGMRKSLDLVQNAWPSFLDWPTSYVWLQFSRQACCDHPGPRSADLDILTEQLWWSWGSGPWRDGSIWLSRCATTCVVGWLWLSWTASTFCFLFTFPQLPYMASTGYISISAVSTALHCLPPLSLTF